MNYCMRCGAPNALSLDKCQKCGNQLKGAIVGNNPTPPPSKPTPPAGGRRSLPALDQVPRQDRNKNMAVIPSMVSAEKGKFDQEPVDGVEVDEHNVSASEDEEGDGVSIDFVPDVQNLEFDPIAPIEVRGVTFGSLVEEAARTKASGK